jgi:hypothetical protein
LCPRAQQLDAGLIADLHPPAGQQRDAPAQIRQFGALAEIQFRARRAKLIVEMVNCGVVALADVTILGLDDFTEIWVVLDFLRLEAGRRRQVWRREHFFPPQLSNASFPEQALIALQLLGPALAQSGFHQPAPVLYIRTVDVPRGLNQAHLFLDGQGGQQRRISGSTLQHFDGGPQAIGQRAGVAIDGVSRGGLHRTGGRLHHGYFISCRLAAFAKVIAASPL